MVIAQSETVFALQRVTHAALILNRRTEQIDLHPQSSLEQAIGTGVSINVQYREISRLEEKQASKSVFLPFLFNVIR